LDCISEAIEELFRRENWKYQKRGERTYYFGFRGENGRYDFWAFINETGSVLSLYALLPLSAPEKYRGDIAEYLHRANYDMMVGNFEMDFRDGEIRFKVTTDFNGEKPDLDHLDRVIDCCLVMSDRYLTGIGLILFRSHTPQQAIAMVESGGVWEERSHIVQ